MSDKRQNLRKRGKIADKGPRWVFAEFANRDFRFVLLLLLSVVTGGCASYGPMRQSESPVVRVRDADMKTFNEAVSLTESLRYEEAAVRFAQVFERLAFLGNRPKAAEALFWLGFCREKQERFAEAGEIYRRVAQEYPSTSAAREAGERLSRLEQFE